MSTFFLARSISSTWSMGRQRREVRSRAQVDRDELHARPETADLLDQALDVLVALGYAAWLEMTCCWGTGTSDP